MNIVQSIKNFFKRGGNRLDKQELSSILEHPKIAMEQEEYERIRDSIRRYEGKYDNVPYKNSNNIEKSRQPSTLNMMKKVAGEYAKVIFNEQVSIYVSDSSVEDEEKAKDNETNAWIQGILEHNNFNKKFAEYLETAMVLGGLVVRPYYDANTKEIEFSWAMADAVYPLQSNTNNISEIALSFRSTRANGDKIEYYTLLEFHEWIEGVYTITNELYVSDKVEKVGKRVPLNTLYDDLEEIGTIEGAVRPSFVYLKAAGFNNINRYSPLGLGVCDNSKNTLDRINRTYDEFNMEIKRGRRRIAVSDMLLNSRIDESNKSVKQFFDDEEDVFQVIPSSNMDDYTIKDLTSDIRTTEYTAAINHHLKTLEMEVGLSAGTFMFNGDAIRSTKTATEIVSEQSQTYQSRNMQIVQVEKFVKELIIAICQLGKATATEEGALFKSEIPDESEIGIDFDDGIFIDKEAQKAYYTSLSDKGLLPGHYVLSKLLDIPEDSAKKLYAEAQAETMNRTANNYWGAANNEEE